MKAELRHQLSREALRRIGGSDLEYDSDKLEQLVQVIPEEQEHVVRAHLVLRVPWDDALVGKSLRSAVLPEPDQASNPAAATAPRRRIERRKIDELRPNPFNAALFPDSLSEQRIAVIAEDLARHGQRVPVEVTPDNTIVDGERRWRGAKHLGWDEVDVVVGPDLSEDELLDRVVDACTASRQMTIREQANVYAAVCERLKREAGREQGRPQKTIQKGNVFLAPEAIREAAAKRAGFSSGALALRAAAIFSRGPEELRGKVLDGSVSISAAYDALPKQRKKEAATEQHEEPAVPPDASESQTPEPADENDGNDGNDTETSQESVPLASVLPEHEDDTRTVGLTASEQLLEPEPSTEEDGPVDDDEGDEGHEEPLEDSAAQNDDLTFSLLGSAREVDDDVGSHVSAVCQHISRLAERDYEDAAAWFEQVVEEMRASLGEPPEVDDDPHDEETAELDGF